MNKETQKPQLNIPVVSHSYLYLVGETLNHESQSWNFQGVYSTEEKAIEKCVKDNFFIARIEIDFDEPVEMREYEYTYYPRLEIRPNCG